MATISRSFAWILHEGLEAYEEFFKWITADKIVSVLSDEDTETVRSLPEPQPSLPLRVLASLGHSARSGSLEFHYTLPASVSGLRDWTVSNRDRLAQLAPEGFEPRQLWRDWDPPQILISGSVPVSWNELLTVARGFARMDEIGTTSVAFILLRDWAFRVQSLAGELDLDLDLALDTLLGRIADGIDPPNLDRLQQLEEEVRTSAGGQHSTVWSIIVALALADGPLDGIVRVNQTGWSSRGRERGSAEPETSATVASTRAYRPATTITSDAATTQDALQYELYADAIARFICDERTAAPLTIGVKAPWGAGKTSLMRMVQRKLELGGVERSETPDHLSNGEVLDQARRPPEEAASELGIDPLQNSSKRATVWFNAWKYQSSEQVWAGLAHAIVSQIEQRMSFAERERFWASLNVKRLDMGEVRRRIHIAFLERLAGYLVALPFLLIALVFGAIASPAAAALGALGVGVGAIADIMRRWTKFKKEPAGTANPQLVRDPGYDGRLGFLHLMHSDLERVLDLVATPELPLVVFIDDLDRCSYTTVAQVIEALNAFLAGDFQNCVFVIAMEPDLVAAQIHVAYRELFDHMAKRHTSAGDLGWRFLEKMVQLPLALPPPETSQLAHFVGSLVQSGRESAVDLQDDDDRVVEARVRIERARGRNSSLAGIESALEVARTADPKRGDVGMIPDVAFERAARLTYAEEFDDRRPEVRALVERHAADLARNPREIKRFLNVFRFYAYVAFWRRSGGVDAPDLEGAAKLATLAVRCPHLLSMLGTDSWLADLEAAAGDDNAWADAVGGLPDHIREEMSAPMGVRAIVRRDPRVGGRAAGFL